MVSPKFRGEREPGGSNAPPADTKVLRAIKSAEKGEIVAGKIEESGQSANWSSMLDQPGRAKNVVQGYNVYDSEQPAWIRTPTKAAAKRFSITRVDHVADDSLQRKDKFSSYNSATNLGEKRMNPGEERKGEEQPPPREEGGNVDELSEARRSQADFARMVGEAAKI